ncbi:hypothetical protein OAJ38_01245, partial [Rhodobiaceae bacterium]|nr:hypothetical protein [Rhodobiaceae bacterium]
MSDDKVAKSLIGLFGASIANKRAIEQREATERMAEAQEEANRIASRQEKADRIASRQPAEETLVNGWDREDYA